MICPKNLIIKYRNTNGVEPEQIFRCLAKKIFEI